MVSLNRKIWVCLNTARLMNIKNLCVLSLLLLLTACSAHPGAGGWHAISNDAKFQRLEIRYAGNADFYTQTDDKIAAWRCFWSAADKITASLKCIDASNADNEKTYLFVVNAETKEGILSLDKKVIGGVWLAAANRPAERIRTQRETLKYPSTVGGCAAPIKIIWHPTNYYSCATARTSEAST